jgi:hypothetical protein
MFGVAPDDQAMILEFIRERWAQARSRAVDAAYLLDPHIRMEFVGDELLDIMYNTIELATSTEALQETSVEEFRISLERYIASKLEWNDSDLSRNRVLKSPTTWWKIRKDMPKLWRFAMKIFSIPASSAASERSWSVHSYIYAKNRVNLLPHRVMKLVYVYSNAGAEKHPILNAEDLDIILGEEASTEENGAPDFAA